MYTNWGPARPRSCVAAALPGAEWAGERQGRGCAGVLRDSSVAGTSRSRAPDRAPRAPSRSARPASRSARPAPPPLRVETKGAWREETSPGGKGRSVWQSPAFLSLGLFQQEGGAGRPRPEKWEGRVLAHFAA